MERWELKTPEDILDFLNEHVEYGWLDGEGAVHRDMEHFRRDYRTASLEDCLRAGVGTCIEQVWLIHTLLDELGLPNKMFCCRIFEPDDFGNLEEEEHMHCFVLYRLGEKVYHLEHPAVKHIGIFEYESEKAALTAIEDHYIQLRGGKKSPTTEFFTVEPGLSFQAFNRYINSLDGGAGLQ